MPPRSIVLLSVAVLLAFEAEAATPQLDLLRNRTETLPLLAASNEGLPSGVASSAHQQARRATLKWLLQASPNAIDRLLGLYRAEGVAAAARKAPAERSLVTGLIRELLPPETLARYREPNASAARKVELFADCVEDHRSLFAEAAGSAPRYVSVWAPITVKVLDPMRTLLLETGGSPLPVEAKFGDASLPLSYDADIAADWVVDAKQEDQEFLAKSGLAKACFAELRCRAELSGDRLSLTPVALLLRSSEDPSIEAMHWRYDGSRVAQQASAQETAAPGSERRGRRGSRDASRRRGARPQAPALARGPVRWQRTTPLHLDCLRDADPDSEFVVRLGSVYSYFSQYGRGTEADDGRGGFSADYWMLRYDRYANLQIDRSDGKDWLQTESGVDFRSQVIGEIFLGDFESVKIRTASQWNGLSRKQDSYEKLLRKLVGQNFEYSFLVGGYVDEASRRFGQEQLNGATPVAIHNELVKKQGGYVIERTRISSETVYVDKRLHIAWALHRDGLPSILSGYKQMYEGKYFSTLLAVKQDIEAFFDKWPQGSPAHRQLIENLARFNEGRPSLQSEVRANVAAAAEGAIADECFTEQVYELLSAGQPVDGKLLGPEFAGQTLTEREVSGIARQRIEAHAAKHGLKPDQITRALLTGQISFDPRDLRLVYVGLVDEGDPTLLDAYRAEQVRLFGVAPVRDFAYEFKMSPELFADRQRNREWNRRFGALQTAIGEETIFQGKPATVTKKLLADRLQDRR